MYYNEDGWPHYIQGEGGYRYYSHEFFTGPFEYTINDCSAQASSANDYTDVLLEKVYQNDQYIETGDDNDYHYMWLTSCDGVNYMFNNEIGWSLRMKAFRDANGDVDFFKFDTDN